MIDVQLMTGMMSYRVDPEDYINAALNIYLDIVLIFLYLLGRRWTHRAHTPQCTYNEQVHYFLYLAVTCFEWMNYYDWKMNAESSFCLGFTSIKIVLLNKNVVNVLFPIS